MARRPKTYLLAWTLAALATAAAYNGAATLPAPPLDIADDHASWLVRDLWQFETVEAEPSRADPETAEPRRALLVAAAMDPHAGLDAEYLSWLQRDLWQFTTIAASTQPSQGED
jgi:hypothetical protein